MKTVPKKQVSLKKFMRYSGSDDYMQGAFIYQFYLRSGLSLREFFRN